MSDSHSWTMSPGYFTPSVTIPASGAPVTVWSLIEAQFDADFGPEFGFKLVTGFRINGLLTSGTDRPAIVTGHGPADMNDVFGAGEDWAEPVRSPKSVYVSALGGSPIANACISVVWNEDLDG